MAHDLPKLPDEFKFLLKWLDPNPDRAVDRYFSIRRGLVKLFEVRGCPDADELADETIDRVVKRAEEFAGDYTGDPAAYFYGVARNVFRESLRRPRADELPDNLTFESEDDDEKERRLTCLDNCLNELPETDRTLIVKYYTFDKGGKSDHRRSVAASLGITVNHLRIRAFRLRTVLQRCVERCLAQAG